MLEGLFHIALADGVFHPNEEQFLAEVPERFGFTDTEFSNPSRFVGAEISRRRGCGRPFFVELALSAGLLMAQNGRASSSAECPLSGVKRT